MISCLLFASYVILPASCFLRLFPSFLSRPAYMLACMLPSLKSLNSSSSLRYLLNLGQLHFVLSFLCFIFQLHLIFSRHYTSLYPFSYLLSRRQSLERLFILFLLFLASSSSSSPSLPRHILPLRVLRRFGNGNLHRGTNFTRSGAKCQCQR